MGKLQFPQIEHWLGTINDVKPFNPPQGSTYEEAETGGLYIYLGNQWIPQQKEKCN